MRIGNLVSFLNSLSGTPTALVGPKKLLLGIGALQIVSGFRSDEPSESAALRMSDEDGAFRLLQSVSNGIGDDLVIVRTRIRRHLTPERIQILLAGKG